MHWAFCCVSLSVSRVSSSLFKAYQAQQTFPCQQLYEYQSSYPYHSGSSVQLFRVLIESFLWPVHLRCFSGLDAGHSYFS